MKIKTLGIACLCIAALTIALYQSCKKESKLSQSLTDSVKQAKTWYENAYLVNGTSTGSGLATLSVNSPVNIPIDYSQHIKPDWDHNTSYMRLGKAVIEIPIDPANSVSSALKNKNTGNIVYTKENSKSSFVIINDGKNYQAFIMTILADATYIGNDPIKLAKNTYRKRDANFSGVVFYFTPKGKFVASFLYKNGKLVPASSSKSSTLSAQKTQSIVFASPCDVTQSINLKTNATQQTNDASNCIDWYLQTFINGYLVSEQYVFTTCDCTGGGGGGGATTTLCAPPNTDTTGTGGGGGSVAFAVKLKVLDDSGSDDGGMGDPTSCTEGSITEENDSSDAITGTPFIVSIATSYTVLNGVIIAVFSPSGTILPSQSIDQNGVVTTATVFNFHYDPYPTLPRAVVYATVGFSVNYQYSDGTPSVHEDHLARVVLTP